MRLQKYRIIPTKSMPAHVQNVGIIFQKRHHEHLTSTARPLANTHSHTNAPVIKCDTSFAAVVGFAAVHCGTVPVGRRFGRRARAHSSPAAALVARAQRQALTVGLLAWQSFRAARIYDCSILVPAQSGWPGGWGVARSDRPNVRVDRTHTHTHTHRHCGEM